MDCNSVKWFAQRSKNEGYPDYIFLTARGEVEDRVKGLESGADDYVAKPFNTKELILRVGKVLSRGRYKEANKDKLRIQMAKVGYHDESIHQLTIDGKPVTFNRYGIPFAQIIDGAKEPGTDAGESINQCMEL